MKRRYSALTTLLTVLCCALLLAPAVFAEAPEVRSNLLVDTQWLGKRLDMEGIKILHVAKDDEVYKEGHIPSAQLVLWDEIAITRDGLANEIPPVEDLTALVRRLGIGEKDRVVLYDEESGLSAARAYVTFDFLGMGDRTAVLDGQLAHWKAEGLPVTKGVREVEPSEFVPQLNTGILIAKDEVAKISKREARTAALIDVRAPNYYKGEKAPGDMKRAGHIPAATNVPPGHLIVSEESPVFKSVEELRELFEAAGVEPGEPVTTYCNSGRQAALGYFALKYLGYDPTLYDGSFMEWGADEEAPVATASGE